MTVWADYCKFHEAAVSSRDVDPVYPVLRGIAAIESWNVEEVVTACLLHVAYYDLGSALAAMEARLSGRSLHDLPLHLPTGVERRGHRAPRVLATHLAALEAKRQTYGGLAKWLAIPMDWANPAARFEALAAQVCTAQGNGRWAGYKTAELLWRVASWPVAAGDLGLVGATGPVAGLKLLQPDDADWTQPGGADRIGLRMVEQLREAGLEAEPAEVETTLCDFHSMVHGRYYVGHDIDQMQAQLDRTPSRLHQSAWLSRFTWLPAAYLGELNGRVGIDRARKGHYRRTGEVLVR